MCEICNHTEQKATMNQYDPTHTLTLRNAFVAEMNRRFKHISKLVTKAVAEEDVFGLNENPLQVFQSTPGTRAFTFSTDSQKITAFLQWLRKVEDAVLLEMTTDNNLQQGSWANVYLAKAFQQGTNRAKQELKKAGIGIVLADDFGMVYTNPVAISKLQVLFTRAFTDLKGITATMDAQISRILAEGLIQGQSPIILARMINTAIIGGGESLALEIPYITKSGVLSSYFMPGRRRAEILARTEIIRAHHIATIQEYRNWEIEGVYVLAEWMTAGDSRVCTECSSLQGTIWSLDEIEGMIPLHPQCRCISLPYVDKTRTKVGGN
jgi:SPP1 gp7 family putative phage head morphogenesis protein